MPKLTLSPSMQKHFKQFFAHNKNASLVSSYLLYVEENFGLHPVLFIRDKIIYQSIEEALNLLEQEGKLWRETEIKIGYVNSAVDDQTKKIYICPFTGKVFGDNTNPNPQDAIYEWVANCKENTERVGGLRVKRFFISEDPKVISEYASKFKPKTPVTKVVFSSAINGKLFHSKEAVIEDCKNSYLKPMTLMEVQNQNRYQIEQGFMSFIEKQLADDKVASFVEALSNFDEFLPEVERWLQEAEVEG